MFLNQPTKPVILFMGLVSGLAFAPLSFAEDDPAETCNSAADLFKEGDVEGALEEARWCVTLLEQLKQNQTSSYFSDEILGYKGGELSAQQTMGMSIVERSYNKDGKDIDVTLTAGASGGADNPFAAITSMGMQSAQGQKVRIQKRTAVVSKEGGTAKVMVTLKSGGILTFESGDVSSDEVVEFAKAFPVAELDDSRG